MEIFKNSCSLDCFDVCKIDVFKENGKVIILWSRNPAITSVHLYKKLIEMKKLGVKIITIDFRKNETSIISDLHINVKGGSDGALALALCKMALNLCLFLSKQQREVRNTQ